MLASLPSGTAARPRVRRRQVAQPAGSQTACVEGSQPNHWPGCRQRDPRRDPRRRRSHRTGPRDHRLPAPAGQRGSRAGSPEGLPRAQPRRSPVSCGHASGSLARIRSREMLEAGSAHEPSRAACTAVQVRRPRPAGPDDTDQANQTGGPVQGSTGPRGPSGRTAPGQAADTAPASDINAAAVTAYRASLQEGKPLSERELVATFDKTPRRWARPDNRSHAGIGRGSTGHTLTGPPPSCWR